MLRNKSAERSSQLQLHAGNEVVVRRIGQFVHNLVLILDDLDENDKISILRDYMRKHSQGKPQGKVKSAFENKRNVTGNEEKEVHPLGIEATALLLKQIVKEAHMSHDSCGHHFVASRDDNVTPNPD